jgi:heterodisulfide reductase subunit A-like polyferredoxin
MTPVESGVPGVFLAGACLGPQDIPETVAQASGAAAKVLAFLDAQKAKERRTERAHGAGKERERLPERELVSKQPVVSSEGRD